MKTINISVRDKLPVVTAMSGAAVTDNKYKLLFDFDDEWHAGLKSVVVVGNRRQYVVYPTETNEVDIELGDARVVYVGVIQDVIATSRPCQIIADDSIKRRMGVEIIPPEKDLWTYITEQIRLLNAAKLNPVEKNEDMAAEVGRDEAGRLWCDLFTTGHGLKSISFGAIFNTATGEKTKTLEFIRDDGKKLKLSLNELYTFMEIPSVTVAEVFPTDNTGKQKDIWFNVSMQKLLIRTGAGKWLAVLGLPEYTEADEGKALQIVGRKPVWENHTTREDMLELLVELGIAPVLLDLDGAVLADNNAILITQEG